MRRLILSSTLGISATLSLGCAAADGAADFSPEGGGDDEIGTDDDSNGGTTGSPDDTTGTDGGDEGGDGDGDGDDGEDACSLQCGEGDCVGVGELQYCDCPPGTIWNEESCDACPVTDGVAQAIDISVVTVSGRFLVGGQPTPFSEYDDANIWLENARTGDRVHVGNTHEGDFEVRVTPGVYDLVYEAETAGNKMPANGRAKLRKLALFSNEELDVDIPVALRTGDFSINGEKPPASEYDDAEIFFRDVVTGDEVLAGNTHAGSYFVVLIEGQYDVVYRAESPGQVMPVNDGAVLKRITALGNEDLLPVEISAETITGDFRIGGVPAPANEYQDGNIELESESAGTVELGNTHGQEFAVRVIPAQYEAFYLHETGADVPQNARAWVGSVAADEGLVHDIDVPMVQVAGVLTLNGGAPPATEYDDAVLSLRNPTTDDEVLLGNTHDGSYAVKLVPGTYDVYYSQETAGGTVPENKGARLQTGVGIDAPMSVDIDVAAASLDGEFTINGAPPPASQYEDGRVYLRNVETGDSILLGSTHAQSYSATVLPGTYDVFYVEETGGDGVPANQDANLGQVVANGGMSLDIEIPMLQLAGLVTFNENEAPNTPSDGGQLYLRDGEGDSVLLGNTYGTGVGANVVGGTYGVFYRSGGSITTPENNNGQVTCFTLQ